MTTAWRAMVSPDERAVLGPGLAKGLCLRPDVLSSGAASSGWPLPRPANGRHSVPSS